MQRSDAERSLEEIRALVSDTSATPVAYHLVEQAWKFAQHAHAGQMRRSGEPHTEHLYQTAKNLAELGMSPTVIAAGILHDTIEDTHVTYEELQEHFGPEIAFLVDGVTKLKKQDVPDKERQIGSIKKLLIAAAQDPRIVVIKLCDRLHNMQTLEYMPPRKRQRIAEETLEIYAAAAERLGLGDIRRKLEELAFPYAYQTEFKETTSLFGEVLSEQLPEAEFIKDVIARLYKSEHFIQLRIRIKSLYGFYRKLKRKNGNLSAIQDVAVVQVIVPTIDACYQMLGLVHSVGRPVPGSLKDFISFPRPNGYRSLRTSIQVDEQVPIEVQIFTPELFHYSLYGDVRFLQSKQQLKPRSIIDLIVHALLGKARGLP